MLEENSLRFLQKIVRPLAPQRVPLAALEPSQQPAYARGQFDGVEGLGM
jgi:hypothetical protein